MAVLRRIIEIIDQYIIIVMIIKPALFHHKFDGFADLPSEVDRAVRSEVMDCNGNQWVLGLFPGGKRDADEPGWIALYLFA